LLAGAVQSAVRRASNRHRRSVTKAVEILEEAADCTGAPLETWSEEQMEEKVELVQTAMEEAYRRHRRSITHAVQDVVAGKPAQEPSTILEEPAQEMPVTAEQQTTETAEKPVVFEELKPPPGYQGVTVEARIRNAVAAAYQREQAATPAAHGGAWYPEQWPSAGSAGQWCQEQWFPGHTACAGYEGTVTTQQGYVQTPSYPGYDGTDSYQACEGTATWQMHGCTASHQAGHGVSNYNGYDDTANHQATYQASDGAMSYNQGGDGATYYNQGYAESWQQNGTSAGWEVQPQDAASQNWYPCETAWSQNAGGYGQCDKMAPWADNSNSMRQAPWRLGSA